MKTNTQRIFTPKEWNLFIELLEKKYPKKRYKFGILYYLQLNTGARFNEAKNVKVKHIDLENKTIILKIVKSKSGFSDGIPRIVPISTKFRNQLYEYIQENNLKGKDYLCEKVSQAGYNQLLKRKLKEIGVEDWYNFSSHNLRKTLETWLVALDVGSLKILKHFGHFQQTALKYYVQVDNFSIGDKILMRKIIDDLYFNFSETEHILYQKINNINKHIRKINRKLKRLEENAQKAPKN